VKKIILMGGLVLSFMTSAHSNQLLQTTKNHSPQLNTESKAPEPGQNNIYTEGAVINEFGELYKCVNTSTSVFSDGDNPVDMRWVRISKADISL
jgi:hypothetical protein